jgi:AbrB family looped-hinge helix DNA binding protein
MTVLRSSDSRVGPEGRAVIPAKFRRLLGISPGDTFTFVLRPDGHVELATPRLLTDALWESNSASGVDATAAIRTERDLGVRVSESDANQGGTRTNNWTPAEISESLLNQLGV